MKARIRQRAAELGFDDCRFTPAVAPANAAALQRWLAAGHHGEMAWLARNAHKRANPQQVLPGAKSIIVIAASYSEARSPKSEVRNPAACGSPRDLPSASIARYARHADYHQVLGARLKELTAFVDQLGGPAIRSLWYVDTGPVLEREFAQRAGLGFIGKHTNLISRRYGNWILLGEILTTLELEPDAPEHNRCGSCSRCLLACPTRAFTAPFQLDARRCISYLTIELKGPIPVELRPAIGNRVFGCDDCLAVCPWNRFAREGRLMRASVRPELAGLDLLELLNLDALAFKRLFADTPLGRLKLRGLRRNVCVALGNVGDKSCLPRLEDAASDADTLVAEHARWATSQIEQRARTGIP
ncbi:MAG TPA: tRNA epoxyqueuosine(34) reductase QueG [Verrucomicrobiae bacterium]